MNPVHTIITAAGSSRRMGGVDKLTLPLENKPLIVHTVESFLNFPPLGQVIVAVNQERVEEFEVLFQEFFPEFITKIQVTPGGKHRQESICRALVKLNSHSHCQHEHLVMIHDGARPFVSQIFLAKLIEAMEHWDSVIPALPVRDTIKRVSGNRVVNTEERETLRLVQTPQVFRLGQILELHKRAQSENFLGTDDASLMERYGGSVGWIEGSSHNLKVTVPEDLTILSQIHQLMQDERTQSHTS